ncbi:MAG TPA: tetratricopeptide repeat protein, partial [Acidocella sp.]|nr:tetratricopeptide repeat protein [Acidocella sp.]
MLADDPRDADALHLLGLILDVRGDPARAVLLIEQAIAVRDAPRFHANHGMVLSRLGQHEAALLAYAKALAAQPDYPEALNNQGATLEQLHRLDEAAASFRAAVTARPGYAEAWGNLGHVLRALRRPDEAEAAYHRAVAVAPGMAGLQAGLGGLLREQSRPAEAEHAYRRQVALAPGDAVALTNLAAAIGEQDRGANAAALLEQALSLAPANPETYCSLGAALQQLGRFEEAEAACRQALALRPGYNDAMANLGTILRDLGQLDAAEAMQRQVIAAWPAEAMGYSNLAVTLVDQARWYEALALLELAVAIAPGNPEIGHHRALLLLLLGRMEEGWAAYEVRFQTKQGRPDQRGFTVPQWRGEACAGRTILLHAEQGFGDTLQFVRYAIQVVAGDGRVVLEVQAPLVELLRHSLPDLTVVPRGSALPAFDLHCPLLSLPAVCGTAAAPPYLAASADAVARWQAYLPQGRKPRVGVVWAGNARHIDDRRRSLPFKALAPLWDLEDIEWVSLQVGPSAAATYGLPPVLRDLSPALTDFAETAAALGQLDLVITVDSAVAHLAGACGVPAWVMLPFTPDWRWLRTGDTTGWYPSLRLFRQDARRTWPVVVEAVALALREMHAVRE